MANSGLTLNGVTMIELEESEKKRFREVRRNILAYLRTRLYKRAPV